MSETSSGRSGNPAGNPFNQPRMTRPRSRSLMGKSRRLRGESRSRAADKHDHNELGAIHAGESMLDERAPLQRPSWLQYSSPWRPRLHLRRW